MASEVIRGPSCGGAPQARSIFVHCQLTAIPCFWELPPFFWQTEAEYRTKKAPAPRSLPGVPAAP